MDPNAIGGIQERIQAPRSIGGRQIRTNLRTTPNYSRPIPPRGVAPVPPNAIAFGGLTKDGLIQERMRWPARTGNELMRTVASRVTTHQPSHYAMLGVQRDFTDAQLRKQLEMLDEDGDGEISNEEVIHFCKNFAEQQLALAEEHEAREAAERDARQLRTRLVGRPRGNLPFFWRRVARVVSPVGRSRRLRPASRFGGAPRAARF